MASDGVNAFDMHPLTLTGMITDSKVDPPNAVIKNFVLKVPRTAV